LIFLALEGITKRIKHFRTQSTYNSLILQSENELHGPNRLKQKTKMPSKKSKPQLLNMMNMGPLIKEKYLKQEVYLLFDFLQQ